MRNGKDHPYIKPMDLHHYFIEYSMPHNGGWKCTSCGVEVRLGERTEVEHSGWNSHQMSIGCKCSAECVVMDDEWKHTFKHREISFDTIFTAEVMATIYSIDSWEYYSGFETKEHSDACTSTDSPQKR